MLKLILLAILCLSLAPYPAFSSRPAPVFGDTLYLDRSLSDYSIGDLRRMTGKKFTLKQKIAYKFVQKAGKRYRKAAEPDRQGNHSFIAALILLGLLSLEFFPITLTGIAAPLFFGAVVGLAFLAFWLGLRSKRKRGKTFKNMFGIIVGGGTILVGIILAISALGM